MSLSNTTIRNARAGGKARKLFDEGGLYLEVAPLTDAEFAQRIAGFYTSLAEEQEPLGPEFEQIWDNNAADLYES